LNDNIVDFNHYKNEKKYNELIAMGASLATDVLINLTDVAGIQVDKIKMAPFIVFFVEALKSLIVGSQGYFHPFQSDAINFCNIVGLTVTKTENGYRYVIGRNEDPPHADFKGIPAND